MSPEFLAHLRDSLVREWAYARHDLRTLRDRRKVLTPRGLVLMRRVRLLELEGLRLFGREGESADHLLDRLVDESITETLNQIQDGAKPA